MKRALLLAGILTLQLVLGPLASNAAASSVYDDAYNVTSDINLYNQNCGGVSQTYYLDHEGLLNFMMNHPTYGSSFTDAVLHGRYGISNYTQLEQFGGQYQNNIAVYWTTSGTMGMSWNTFGGTNHNVTPSVGVMDVLVYAYGGSCSLQAYNPAGSPFISTNAAGGSVYNYYIRVDYPDYPSGYEGALVPWDVDQGLIQGNVQCTNDQNIISDVLVNVDAGVDGEAYITNDGIGGKNYYYFLTEPSDYSLIVMCDGDPLYGPTVDVDWYDYYHWVCTITGQSLGVCAAS